MKAHYFQHVEFEGLGLIETELLARGYEISRTRWYLQERPPEHEQIDCLIIMGGPMSVNDQSEYPWLVDEMAFIKKAIDLGKPVLGICLGAQLIAKAFGSEVYPGPAKEIGWWPITNVSGQNTAVFAFPEQHTTFHWHGETFDLPPSSVCLAKSPVCKHQAFQLGSKAIGLQFHLEMTASVAKALTQHCAEDLAPGEYAQSAEEIIAAPEQLYSKNQTLLIGLLDFLLD